MYPNRSSDSIHSQPTVLIKKSMVTRQAWNQARKSNQWAGIREKIRKVLIGCRCTSSITQVSGKGLTIKVATEQRRGGGGFKRADSYFFKAVLSQPSEPMHDMAVGPGSKTLWDGKMHSGTWCMACWELWPFFIKKSDDTKRKSVQAFGFISFSVHAPYLTSPHLTSS